MYYTAVLIFIVGCSWLVMTAMADEGPASAPGFNERLNEAVGAEGGVQVYQDSAGNVGTIIDPPGGERRFTVQPPQSPSMNLGPPLQLSPVPFKGPSKGPSALTPTHPLAPEAPQEAR